VTEDDLPGAAELLVRARHARVYEVARVTPLDPAPQLAEQLGRPVLLKREDLQPTFSFKLRGAYQRMATLDAAERACGVVAASAGNHAQGVALAAARLGIAASLVMPLGAPKVKVDAVRRLGGQHVEVRLAGASYSEAQAEAQALAARRGACLVHPFDDVQVITGQATVGLELLDQWRGPLVAVFVPVGGGGLLAGMATVIKAKRPQVRVIGVQAEDADAMARSFEAGARVALDDVGLFADGTAVKQVGALTYALCRRHADAIVRVDTRAICTAIRDIHQELRCVPEPAGALALAGLRQWAASNVGEGVLAAVVSGANMNFDSLRFVAERVAMA
jgi:threonine dehydratase